MGVCYWCYHGWPACILEIYGRAFQALGGDSDAEIDLEYGPAHVVWGEEDFELAEDCLSNFEELSAWWIDKYTPETLAIIKQSLVELSALPMSIRRPPADYDGENPENFPPPEHWNVQRKP